MRMTSTRGKSKAKKGRYRDEDDERPRKSKSLAEQVKAREDRSAPGPPVSSFVILAIVAAVILPCGGGIGIYFLVHKDTTKQQNNPPAQTKKR